MKGEREVHAQDQDTHTAKIRKLEDALLKLEARSAEIAADLALQRADKDRLQSEREELTIKCTECNSQLSRLQADYNKLQIISENERGDAQRKYDLMEASIEELQKKHKLN